MNENNLTLNSSVEIANQLVFELATGIREKYKGDPDCSTQVQLRLQKFGIKPGFALAAQMVPETINENSMEQIVLFLTQQVSREILGATAEYSRDADGKQLKRFLKFTFAKEIPSIFKRFGPLNKNIPKENKFWIKAYGYFILGVYQGALLHFGLPSLASFELNKEDGTIAFQFRWETVLGSRSAVPTVTLSTN